MVRVVMAPGWDRKIMMAADPHIGRVARRVERQAKANIATGGHIVTGALFRSVRTSRVKPAHHRVWIGTDHWHYIEYGTPPHKIYPRGNYPLRFWVDGRYIVTWSVNHPGNRAYAVMRRALY